MLRRLFFPAVVVWCAAHCRAEDAQSTFDSLYGPRLKQVAATGDKADDLVLAKDMLRVVKASTENPQFVALMCDAIYDLASRHADGYPAALDAMSLLAETVPDKRAAAREKLIEVLTKQSRTGKAEEREEAGEELITLLSSVGDEKFDAKKWTEAAVEYRRALALAASKKSPQMDEVKAKLEEAGRRDRVEKQLALLRERLLKNATDTAAADDLMKLYLLDLDHPAGAVEYQTRAGDAALKEIVTLANRTTTDLKSAERLRLAEWYFAAARPLRGAAQSMVLKRAEQHLTTVLADPETQGLSRTKSEVLLRDVRRALVAAAPSNASAIRPMPLRRFYDVFERTDRLKLKDGILEGDMAHIDAGQHPRLAKPVKGKTFRFGVRMKASQYHCIWGRVDGTTFLISRGHWNNSATMVHGNDTAELRLNGIVDAPGEWALVEMEFTGTIARFYYNGKAMHEMKVTKPAEADAYEIVVGFYSHETRLQVKEIYLTVDGKPQFLTRGGAAK